MSPSLLSELDGVNFASASPVMLTTVGSSGRAIDRFSPHLHDPLRAKKTLDVAPESDAYKKSRAPRRADSPAGSSRYLLADSTPSDDVRYSQPDVVDVADEPWRFQESTVVMPPDESWLTQSVKDHESCSTTCGTSQNHQIVVVLRVSLHCKGCEEKVRKHISKMEGVTSFTTDLINKKVTVIGDVTPLGVLNSVSKVKNARLWRSLPLTSSSS